MFPFNKKHPPKEYQDFIKLIEHNLPQDPFDELCGGLPDGKARNLAIRLALAEEQGYLCCYCQQRIPMKKYKLENGDEVEMPDMNIEHFKPRSIYDGQIRRDKHLCDEEELLRPDLRIEWSNLLCACLNHEGYCGDIKGNYELCHIPNPALAKDFYHKTQIYWNERGIVKSHIKAVNREIGGVIEKQSNNKNIYEKGKLNLNCQELINKRKGAWSEIIRRITKEIGIKDWEKKRNAVVRLAKDFLEEYEKLHEEKKNSSYQYREQAWFIVSILKKKFKELR